MPTTTTNIIAPTIGYAFAIAVDLWKAYVVDVTATFAWSLTAQDGKFCVVITVKRPDATVETRIVTVSHRADADVIQLVSLPSVLESPGWNTAPIVTFSLEQPRDIVKDWSAQIVPLKIEILRQLCDAFVTATSNMDVTVMSGNLITRLSYFGLQAQEEFYVGAALIRAWSTASPYQVPPANPFGSGVSFGSALYPVSVVGAAQDLTPIVNAIDAIAMQDVDVSFNNGQSIFSVRSRVNV